MAKFIRRITVVSMDGGSSETIFKKRRRKRKISRWLRPMERRDRRVGQSMKAFSDEWLGRHRRSNRRRKDGWMRDANRNWFRASRKAYKKLFKV